MSEQLPDYQRPFAQEDFRGYFTWTADLTSQLRNERLYHACHEEELQGYLKKKRLELKSKWSLELPVHGMCHVPGVWTGLNYFHNGNNYGPLLISFPLSKLNGANFMVFRRRSAGSRRRYFFVEYEARIPIYSYDNNQWREVDPCSYFYEEDGKLSKRLGAIYDIVLTESISLKDCEIRPVNHPFCISGKCSGNGERQGRKLLRDIAKKEFSEWLRVNDEYHGLLKRFPVLDGEEFELFDPKFA
jgi:hypothetical protein